MTFNEQGERLYTTAEAAKILKVRPKTIIKLVSRGVMKPAGRLGRSHLFSASEVERYQRERRPPHRPPQQQLENPQSATDAPSTPNTDISTNVSSQEE